MKPFWHKYLNNADFDVVTSEDGAMVSIAYKRVVSREDVDRALLDLASKVLSDTR